MKDKAIITVRFTTTSSGEKKKNEHDLEVPLSITAYDLFIALNETFQLGRDVSNKEICVMRSERPDKLLYGNQTLSECGVRNGTVINLNFTNIPNTEMRLEADESGSIGAMHYPEFIRNSRLKIAINNEPIVLLGPKAKLAKPKSSLLLNLLPALGMIAISVILYGLMDSTGLTFIIVSVASVLLGAIVSTISMIKDIKEYKQQYVDRKIGYQKYINKMDKAIDAMRQQELQLLNKIYYRYDETSRFALSFSGSLFDRIPSDDDFLEVRVGIGSIDSLRKIEYKAPDKYEADDDDLLDLPLQLANKYKKISNAPILIHLKTASVVGVVGENALLYEMMKIIFFDLCVRQHYEDLSVFLMIGSDEKTLQQYEWTKWFKHLNNDESRNIVCDESSKNYVFESLYTILSAREESHNETFSPHIVVFVLEDYGIKEHPVSKYIEKASDYGATFVFFENSREYIPLGCSELIMVDDEAHGRIIRNENTEIVDFTYIQIKDDELYTISYKLAPVYSQAISIESGLRNDVSLFEILGIKQTNDLNVVDNWLASDTLTSLSAPIGINSKGKFVTLDIKDGDKSHGPHGLVAGTTGSGKSELLMSYILSMAAHFSPHDVAFLIIDFKGGGMADNFENLPHTLGIIRNIDGNEINRSLTSIMAEIKKRQRLFKEAKEIVKLNTGKEEQVQDINDYLKLYRNRAVTGVKTVIPHLIIVVDEFAELKEQFSDFIEGLKSAARIGRTLGVHLILATQRPQGQVDPEIDSNSKFRLCLKVQTPSDSVDIIKSPMAAEIKESGRCYLMVGNNEIFELFQSAYGGFPETHETDSQCVFSIKMVDFSGKRKTIYEKKYIPPRDSLGNSIKVPNQKVVLVQLLDSISKSDERFGKLNNICEPPLPKALTADDARLKFGVPKQSSYMIADIGIYDDPQSQYQGYASLDVGNNNTMIIGSSQMGKTNLLQWIIKDLSTKHSSEELNFYVLDFGSMILKNFSELNHVGGVVCATDDEKLKNFFKMINEEILVRREKFNAVGLSSLKAYKEAGHNDIPQIIILIDNLTALQELYLEDDDQGLLLICREGLSVGISVIIANPQLSGIGYRYLLYFSNKISFYCNDDSSYLDLFSSCKVKPLSIPGRALIELNKECYECQTFISFEGDKEHERVKKMREYVQNQISSKKAKPIPFIPDESITFDYIKSNYNYSHSAYSIPIGLDYGLVEPLMLDFSTLHSIALCGKSGFGQGNFIRYIVNTLRNMTSSYPVNIVMVDDYKQKFKGFQSHFNTYTLSMDSVKAVIENWHSILQERYENLMDSSFDLSTQPLLMLIVNNKEFHGVLEEDTEIKDLFFEMLEKYKNLKFCVIYTYIENEMIDSYNSPDSLSKIRDTDHYLIFEDAPKIKIVDIPFDFEKKHRKPLKPGEAYLTIEGEYKKVKTLLA